MKRYFLTLKGPLIILLITGVLSHLDKSNAFSVLFKLAQAFAIFSSGWLLSRDLKQSIGTASYSGAVLLFIYIFIVVLLPFVLFPPTIPMPADMQTKDLLFGSLQLTVLLGLFISYLLCLPVYMAIAAFGAYLNIMDINQARFEAKWKKPWRPKSWDNLIDSLPVVTSENYMLVLSKFSGAGKYYHPSIYSVLANCYQYTNRKKYYIALIMSGDWTVEEELEFMPWVLSLKKNNELQLLSQFPECFKFRSSIHVYPEKTKLFISEHLSSTFMFKRI